MNVAILDSSQRMMHAKSLVVDLIQQGYRPFFVVDREKEQDLLDTVGPQIASFTGYCEPRQFVSMVRRKEVQLHAVEACDVIIFVSDFLRPAENMHELLYLAMTVSDEVLLVHHDAMQAKNILGNDLSKAFETFNIQDMQRVGGYVMPWKAMYDRLILQRMGGENELRGYNEMDGKMQLVATSDGSLQQITEELGRVKDIIELDLDYENVLKWCRNCMLPGVERLDLAAVLINMPAHGAPMRPELTPDDWSRLMDHLDDAGYPYIISSVLHPKLGWHSLPDEVITRSTHVVQVLSNDLFVAVLKDRYNG